MDINTDLTIEKLIKELACVPLNVSAKSLHTIFKKHTKQNGEMYTKTEVIKHFMNLSKIDKNLLSKEEEKTFHRVVKMKRTRTISGVTPVTVLTKPYPCPGKCIFCPNDVRMPKSYLSDEPGAQRAALNKFDPYLQTFNRLIAFKNMGHATDKIELLILGGTWTFYPPEYQIWFVKRCFDALNDFEHYTKTSMLSVDIDFPYAEDKLTEIDGTLMTSSYNQIIAKSLSGLKTYDESATWDELFLAHSRNEKAKTKCIGLVIETRPDEITENEVINIRRLGATRVQLGVQSLDDNVLTLNKRGHDVAQTVRAFSLLRLAGFKILAHWMPNLLGASPISDISDYKKLFEVGFCPDELKIYPCSLIASAELMQYYKSGKWIPYGAQDLEKILVSVFENTPRYARLTRVIRDIPSTDIVAGNKKTNLRQDIETIANKLGITSCDIRSREIKDQSIDVAKLNIKVTIYETAVSTEHFIEYVTDTDHIAGFLRLCIPKVNSFIEEIADLPIIRELHVYGESLRIGADGQDVTQHRGLGKSLILYAEKICIELGFNKLCVISSIGTRGYYAKLGFVQDSLYQIKQL